MLLIADSDSQLLACEALCSARTEMNVQWSISVIPRDGTPRALLQRLAQRASLRHQGLTQLLRDRRLKDFDAIGVFLTGSKINDIRLAIQRDPNPPLLFCGFNGVVLDHFIEGVSWRPPAHSFDEVVQHDAVKTTEQQGRIGIPLYRETNVVDLAAR